MTFEKSRHWIGLISAISISAAPGAWAQAAAPAPNPSPSPSAPKPAEPKKVDDARKAEAAHRFDRGLQLFEAGDNAGALAEFKRTYELFPNFVVLCNIGLVYAAMGRPVDAVDALEPAIDSNQLPAKQLERAKQTLADQKARVGRLIVTTNPEGARVEVDNVEVARTPLTGPIRVAEGSHIIGAVAEGYAPARKEVVIAGNSDASLALELVPTQGKQLANLAVRTNTLAADVVVDGEVVGKTPLATSITLVAGHHVVEVRRPGYVPARRELDVGPGATGDLAFDLAVDPSALGVDGATLVLDVSESPAELSVDGERKGIYSAPLRLPRGPHHISVAAAGFIPLEREVTLEPGQSNVVRVVLEPTPETRKSYESSARFHRTWGWLGVIAGAALAGGGGALFAVGSGKKSDGESQLANRESLLNENQSPCNWRDDYISKLTGASSKSDCDKLRSDATDKVNSGKTQRTIGIVGLGVGAAVAVTGVVLLLTGNDPDKYDRPEPEKLGARRKPRFALTPGPAQLGAGLSVTF